MKQQRKYKGRREGERAGKKTRDVDQKKITQKKKISYNLIRTQIQYNKSLKANDKSLEWYDVEREI